MDIRQIAQALGRRGGRARARNLAPERRKQIAALGGDARRRSLEAARRFTANFVYAGMVRALRPPPVVERTKSFNGRLPGLYRHEDSA